MATKNRAEYVKDRLATYSRNQVVFSHHALIRMERRQITKARVIKDLMSPEKLQVAVPEKAENEGEEKFDCYFGYTKNLCYRYVLILANDIVVVTAVKIQKKWQARAEKKLARTK